MSYGIRLKEFQQISASKKRMICFMVQQQSSIQSKIQAADQNIPAVPLELFDPQRY